MSGVLKQPAVALAPRVEFKASAVASYLPVTLAVVGPILFSVWRLRAGGEHFISGGALTEVLLRFASQLVGHVPGGLGHANVLTLTFFSGISGSASSPQISR